MPTQWGTASVYGVDGTVTISGAAYAVIPDSAEGEQTAEVEEFKNGLNQLLGFYKSDERFAVDLTLIPKAATIDAAEAGLKYPVIPAKVTLGGFVDTAVPSLEINGDYIYVGGARRTSVRGQSALRMRIFRPLDLPVGVTVTTLTTQVT